VADLAAERALRQLNWRYFEAELLAAVDGEDALLVPSTEHQFDVVVDPRLSRREAWMVARCSVSEVEQSARSTRAFRIGHELGHALFFDFGRPPRRIQPHQHEEEHFCDSFSRALMVPRNAVIPATAPELARFASDHEMSLEVAAGSLVDRQPWIGVVGGTIDDGEARVRFATANIGRYQSRLARRWSPMPLQHIERLDGAFWRDAGRFLVSGEVASLQSASSVEGGATVAA
jgi:hypothetical protein